MAEPEVREGDGGVPQKSVQLKEPSPHRDRPRRGPGQEPVRPPDPEPGSYRLVQEARPPGAGQEPGHVRRARGHGGDVRRVHRPSQPVRLEHHSLALPHGDLCQLRRGHGRRPGQGPSRDAPSDAFGDGGPSAPPRWHRRASRRFRAQQGRHGGGRGRRHHPLGRRDRRRHRVRGRVGHHRRIGASDP